MPADTRKTRVEVEGRELTLSNLDKVLFPEAGYTKGEVIDYYTRIAPVLLPHLTDRPVTRIRFPNGVDDKSFFEKNAPASTPDWVRLETLPVPGSSKGRETIAYVVADDLPTLVWLANLAALELHTPQWKIGRHPDMLVVDLDPGAPAGLAECCAVALLMRDRLADDGLDSYPKTSGKKGMQLCCPIAGNQDADLVSGYAHRIAAELERAHPKLIVSKMAKNLRPGKVFIDWSQNNAAKTTVAPYSLRAQPTPSVSTPLTWAEVEAGTDRRRRSLRHCTPDEVLERVDEHGDLLAPLLTPGPKLPIG
ncbi:non-homologous end-joining DNA ligase [Micromonospora sp. CPCC 206060]|uniref:non-homologous end-joining DNA ligase n=1 Tax=Micromonospora sp. CPCC 206060 TaxID=3122406 RepID=UPI002FF090B7